METIEVGEAVTLRVRFLNDAGVPTNPTVVTLVHTDPSNNPTTVLQAALTNVSAGVWTFALTVDEAGIWTYRFEGTGVVVAGETGYFLVLAEGASPTVGPCESWISSDDLFDCEPCSSIATADRNYELAATAIETASDLLFRLADRKYPGVCLSTVRPCRRSKSCWPTGWHESWGHCRCADMRRCGCGGLSEVRLGVDHPVLGILSVRVDGVTLIEGTDYRLDDAGWLVRLDDETWPSCQDLSLAATAVDTWDVSFAYGRVPTTLGILAAKTAACEFYQLCAGGTCKLPSRIRTLTRQGMEVGFIDPQEFLAEGRTGLYAVDLFLSAERYDAAHQGTVVASPDVLPAVRRTAT